MEYMCITVEGLVEDLVGDVVSELMDEEMNYFGHEEIEYHMENRIAFAENFWGGNVSVFVENNRGAIMSGLRELLMTRLERVDTHGLLEEEVFRVR